MLGFGSEGPPTLNSKPNPNLTLTMSVPKCHVRDQSWARPEPGWRPCCPPESCICSLPLHLKQDRVSKSGSVWVRCWINAQTKLHLILAFWWRKQFGKQAKLSPVWQPFSRPNCQNLVQICTLARQHMDKMSDIIPLFVMGWRQNLNCT